MSILYDSDDNHHLDDTLLDQDLGDLGQDDFFQDFSMNDQEALKDEVVNHVSYLQYTIFPIFYYYSLVPHLLP
jgi:hypothetical protein